MAEIHHSNRDIKLAVKKIPIYDLDGENLASEEVHIHSTLRHRNVVGYVVGWISDEGIDY